MKLTRATDYAIRLLSYLAADGKENTSVEIAKALNIPFNHLSKLVHQLGRQGYLVTRKGKGGGIQLAVDPKKASLIDVIELIEGPMSMSECILNLGCCENSKTCKFRKKLSGAQALMREALSKSTISDLVLRK